MDIKEEKKAKWPMEVTMPVIEQGGLKSTNVYFILSGTILILDRDCVHEYGRLNQGSYFGEISPIFDEPNGFSYGYNPFDKRSVQCLMINCHDFLRICRQYPLSYEVILRRAWNRKKMFENYKSYNIIANIKKIVDYPDLIQKKILEIHKDVFFKRVAIMREITPRTMLLRALLKQYELSSFYNSI